mmetsp:Transcript_29383/g.52599  ORF Transcript_29383/g.52599 Transcript_29383/m.52599 type:complete len:113 (-) Transcript_29383:59-397(-)
MDVKISLKPRQRSRPLSFAEVVPVVPPTPSIRRRSLDAKKTRTKKAVQVPSIKRRFKNASRLLKKVPVNELFESIVENCPFVGNVLARNWTKVEQAFKKIDAVQEVEEDTEQ